jgi:hypothetical protein
MRSFECQRRADLLNNLRALIRRCRIKTVFNTLRDKGIELRVRHTLHSYWGDGGLGLLRYQRCNQAHERHRAGPGRGYVNLSAGPFGLPDCAGFQEINADTP